MKNLSWGYLHILFFLLFLSACAPLNTPTQPPEAIAGVIDLSDWDFEKDGSVILSGEWGFFWEELLPPDQITQPAPYYVDVPDIWTDYEIEGITTTAEGYATYTLTLIPPDTDITYGLYVEGQGSAFSLWIDGQLVAQNGQVGTDYESMTPEKKPNSIFFHPRGESVELVMQVSNFHHRKGGFRNDLILGLDQPIHQFQMQSWFGEAFSVGILFVMGLYHTFIYVSRKKHKAPLYLALLCWGLAVRIGITNQNTFLFLFPWLNWFAAFRLEYLTFFLTPPLFAWFLHLLYPKDVPRWFPQISMGFGIAFTVFMLFVDTITASYIPTYYQAILLLEIAYGVFLFVLIIIRRRENAWYMSIASVFWLTAVVIEILYFQNLLPFGKVSPYGFLAFIFVQAILLASRFSKSFRRVETLSEELENKNIDIQQNERKYRTIFEDSKDVIFIAGLDTNIEDISPSCEEVLGYTKKELENMPAHKLMANPEIIFEYEDIVIKEGSIRDIEVELIRKDGKSIDALISVTLRHDENNEIAGFQGSVRDITERKQAQTERLRALMFEQISITDPLTKIYNRRFFSEAADKELERAKRSGSPLALIIFDIDHFKKVNDTYGHLVGDEVLINLANLCQNSIRSVDLFARFGGEEFVILMPDTDMKSAQETSERLREIVAENPQTTVEETDISITITISIGIAHWGADNPQEINTLLNRADQALYQAKESGRNRVVVWQNNGVS